MSNPLRFSLVSSNRWNGVRLRIASNSFCVDLSEEEQEKLLLLVDKLKYHLYQKPENKG